MKEIKENSKKLNMQFFPFKKIRKGQKDFQEDARRAILEGKHLIAHAPTGIGKTAAVIAPALEFALENNKFVLFLTSKQSQHKIAVETLKKIKEKGFDFIAVDIISKKSMCPRAEAKYYYSVFNEYCKGLQKSNKCYFYQKHSSKLSKKIEENIFHVEELMENCRKYGVCPHRAALDVASNADIMICDYNYIFSDISETILTKIEKNQEDIILVIDEAHNLPDRIRNNLSKELNKFVLEDAKREVRTQKALIHHIKGLLEIFNSLENSIESNTEKIVEKDWFLKEMNRVLATTLIKMEYDDFVLALQKIGMEIAKDENKSSVLFLAEFLEHWKKFDSGTVRIFSNFDLPVLSFKLLDPSIISKEIFSNVYSSIMMSGTLYPMQMYADILGLEKERAIFKKYKSPFPKKNKLILVSRDVTTLYRERSNEMYQKIAKNICDVAKLSKNTAVFFPSYAIMENVLNFIKIDKSILLEERNASKSEKNQVYKELVKLKSENGGLLLGVQGGSFSEGVDYADNLLDAVIVVGLPLAPPTLEVEALLKYYKEKFGREKGYDYAYLFPALNRVMQASGRLIRSEKDRGIIVLMDKRFAQYRFSRFIYEDLKIADDLEKECSNFFNSISEGTI